MIDSLLAILALYYFIINAVLIILMGIDKRRAKRDEWRIRESTLLITALLGGGIGGFIGMKIFRHKTKKWYFHAVFAIGIILHIVVLWLLKYKL